MSKIKGFKGVRPTRDKAYLTSSLPAFFYEKNILEAKLQSNPFSFLHIINPEFDSVDKTEINSIERFEKVKQKYREFREKGIFLQDEKECIYLSRQTTPTHTYIGIIAGVSTQDYINGDIKIHEHTLTEREQIFKQYLEVCQFNAEPVLLTYKDDDSVNEVIDKYVKKRAEYEFMTNHLIRHDLWVIENENDIATLKNAFEKIPFVYIADGHHRLASSVLYAQDKNNEMANYFSAFFIQESKLNIEPYHRVVKDLNGYSVESLLHELEKDFEVKPQSEEYTPVYKNHFGMFVDNKWYELKLKTKVVQTDNFAKTLDVQQLSDKILEPILGIKDLKTDKRVGFIEGTKNNTDISRMINEGEMQIAFTLYPVSLEELKKVSDNKEIMPPKSTWIEPKMRSGLVIYDLEN